MWRHFYGDIPGVMVDKRFKSEIRDTKFEKKSEFSNGQNSKPF